MKFVDEFRDPETARRLIFDIGSLASKLDKQMHGPLKLMEFCGGHTHTLFRYGIEQLLPQSIEMIHGPGCPVCVLPMGRIDDCVQLAENRGVIFTTFGDAMRVPGSQKNLLQAKAEGADIRMVYSPLDALQLARNNPDREVIFFALGFETTMPSTALTVLQAERENLRNFSLFCNHITTAPTIKAVLDSPNMDIDGFIAPGHVSMVIGERPFDFVAKHYRKPIVITGFEPLDILQSLYMLLGQFAGKRCQVENQYTRVVPSNGNKAALDAMAKVFAVRESFEWRGLGLIDHSGVKMCDRYAHFDAEKRFTVTGAQIADPESCRCGDVLKGIIKPWECRAFGNSCKPETPLGALMVSSEGACAAYFNYAVNVDLINKRKSKRDNSETA